MIAIKLETQMRSGSHYLLNALSQVYHAKPAGIKLDGTFDFVTKQRLSQGLYEDDLGDYNDTNGIVLQYHYYHAVAYDERLENAKTIYLIGFPFDSFFSDGLICSLDKYTVAPSQKNKCEKYRFSFGSKEWVALEPYMHKNAAWLRRLARNPKSFIIRYEDFFNDYHGTLKRIEKHLGPFREIFPKAVQNSTRMYWTGDHQGKLDQRAFEALCNIFFEGLKHFWPERVSFYYQVAGSH